jgi:hypothetical protein
MTTIGAGRRKSPARRVAAVQVLVGLVLIVLVIVPTPAAAPAAAASPCETRYPSDDRVAWDCRVLRRGETVERLFGRRWVDVLRFNRIDRRRAVAGVVLKVPRRLDDVRAFTSMPASYPEAAGESKFILVDLAEQFLGAYERGRLAFSSPLSTGALEHPTPTGDFTLTAAHRHHASSLYTIGGTDIPYPMTWALRFHTTREGVSFWLHGRDIPGYPASHGCIGLYDESMQFSYYGRPARPVLDDARRVYEWVVGAGAADARIRTIAGPRLRIVHSASGVQSEASPLPGQGCRTS